jgi:hypothetical protein
MVTEYLTVGNDQIIDFFSNQMVTLYKVIFACEFQECYKALRNESMLIRKQNAQEKSSIAEQQREV